MLVAPQEHVDVTRTVVARGGSVRQPCRSLLESNAEAIFCCDFHPPVSIAEPEQSQLEAILASGSVTECNDAMAYTRGAGSGSSLVGRPLDGFLCLTGDDTAQYLRAFIRGNHRICGGDLRETDREGNRRCYLADLIGVVENGLLTRMWGMRRDITLLKAAEEDLRTSELRYRQLADSASDILFTVNLEGNLTFWNTSLERFTGFRRGEPVHLRQILAPKYLEGTLKLIRGGLPNGRVVVEVEMRTAAGAHLSVELGLTALRTGDEVSGAQGSGHNVTGRKATERFEDARRDIIEMVARDAPLGSIMERLSAIVDSHFVGATSAISKVYGGKLTYVAGNLPDEFQEAFTGTRIGPMSLSCGTAAFLERAVVASDISTDPTWIALAPLALRHGLHACWSTPVSGSSGKVLGTLAVYFPDPREVDADMLDLLKAAADLAAVTIEHHSYTEELRYQATHDSVTALPNRYYLQSRLRSAIADAPEDRFSVLYIDLDGFKLVNDTYGHTVGDELLRQIAVRLAGCIGPRDLLARVGGDEFVILLLDPVHADEAPSTASAIRLAFTTPVMALGRELFVGVSIGISVYPDDGTGAEALLSNADAALARAKSEGKNTFRLFTPVMLADVTQRLELQNELHRALSRNELTVYYQPQYNLQTGRLAGKEALLRWRSQSCGDVGPTDFIPIAEESGLILPIGEWVMRQACMHGVTLQTKSALPVRIAVNVSAVQLAQPDFVQQVSRILAETGMPPHLLELELTETALMRNPRESAQKMAELRRLGLIITVDDFGTGYSSLTRLQQLPLDSLKIDLSFVREIKTIGMVPPIVQAIIALARGLGVSTTAEGVESREQLQVLRDLGCTEAQGFLLGCPLPPEAPQQQQDDSWFASVLAGRTTPKKHSGTPQRPM